MCAKCTQNVKTMKNAGGRAEYAVPVKTTKRDDERYEKHVKEVDEALSLLRLRQRGVVERKIAAGEIKHKSGVGFVYTDNEELEFEYQVESDDDGDDNDEEEDVVKKKKGKKIVEESKEDIVEDGPDDDSDEDNEDDDQIMDKQ